MRDDFRSHAVPSVVKHVRRVIRVGSALAAILIIAVVVGVYVLSATNAVRFVPVLSNSMAPSMPVGALAVTHPVARQDVAVGDVIVFTDPNNPRIRVIHRVLHIYGADEASKFTNWHADELIAKTKGDNNPDADPWVLKIDEPTIWRLERSFAEFGKPAIWFDIPVVRTWVFGAAGVALVGWMLALVWWRPAREQPADDEDLT